MTTVRKFSQGAGAAWREDDRAGHPGRPGRHDLQYSARPEPDGRPRFDGYEIRTAAVLRNIPCVTTVPGLAAAVQGIESIIAGNVGVRSLQSWSSSDAS